MGQNKYNINIYENVCFSQKINPFLILFGHFANQFQNATIILIYAPNKILCLEFFSHGFYNYGNIKYAVSIIYDTAGMEIIMFRLWAKIFKDNRMLKDICIENGDEDTRTHKVFHALDEVCYAFDLGKPIWLDKTIAEFKRHDKARFTQDNFIESIDFDYLEIHVIEED